jgi:hypothetical protein
MLDIRWRILLVALAGWVNRRQLDVIAYLREENRVLKEHPGDSACTSRIPNADGLPPPGTP